MINVKTNYNFSLSGISTRQLPATLTLKFYDVPKKTINLITLAKNTKRVLYFYDFMQPELRNSYSYSFGHMLTYHTL